MNSGYSPIKMVANGGSRAVRHKLAAMTSKARRKAARQAFKARTPPRGAFAVRCTATGRSWVGSGPNLDAARNGLWSALRIGACREVALQAEWMTHGEASFVFETLELLPDDVSALNLRDELNAAKTRWALELGAAALL